MNAVIEAPLETPKDPRQTATILEIVSRAASDPHTDVAKTEKLLEIYERIAGKNAEIAFNAAMTAAQAEMGRISTDMANSQTHSRYASYGKLDKALRPLYTKHGFALSFDEGDSPKAEHVRVLCHVSHTAGHSRIYHKDIPADGKGAKGGDVMTKTHAVGAAMAYGMRYLLKGIFNVAIGEDDKDGNDPVEKITEKQAMDLEALITEHKGNKAKLLQYLKVKSLAEIPAANFEAVVKEVRALAARAAEQRK